MFLLYGQKLKQANRKQENMQKKQAAPVPWGNTHVTYFFIFHKWNMENVSVVVSGKTPMFI